MVKETRGCICSAGSPLFSHHHCKHLFRTFCSSSELKKCYGQLLWCGKNMYIWQSVTHTITLPCFKIMPGGFLTHCCIANYIVYHGNKHLLHSMFKRFDEDCPPASWDSVRHHAHKTPWNASALNEVHVSVRWSGEVLQVVKGWSGQGSCPCWSGAISFSISTCHTEHRSVLLR